MILNGIGRHDWIRTNDLFRDIISLSGSGHLGADCSLYPHSAAVLYPHSNNPWSLDFRRELTLGAIAFEVAPKRLGEPSETIKTPCCIKRVSLFYPFLDAVPSVTGGSRSLAWV